MAGSDDLRRLEVDLGRVASRAVPEVEKVMKRGAQNLKDGMVEAFSGSRFFRGAARRVSYERKGFFGSVGYEVGLERGGAGSLAHIAVDGGANGGGGTVDIDGLLPAEAAEVERHITRAIEDLL